MKPIIPFALLGALFAVGAAQAASTTPVGYETVPLDTAAFNLVSLRLQGSTASAGDFETVAGVTLTDSDVDFTATLTAGATYILEVTSENAAVNGVLQEITAWSGNSLTTPQDLQALGLTTADSYLLRKAPTIEEVFGTTTSQISKGPTAASTASDVIWVPGATAGAYTRYYIRSTDSTVRNAQTNAAAPNVPIVYLDGLFVEKKTSAAGSLTVTGEVKKTGSVTVLTQGFNLVGTVYPAGATLQNIGLDDDISKGPTAASTSSDIVWVPTGPGAYTRYYLRSTDSTWRNAQTNAAVTTDVDLPASVLIERKPAAAVNVDLTPPASYASL